MIPLFKVYMSSAVDLPLLQTIHSGYIGQGPKVDEFERRISEYLDTPYVLTTISGTAALHLALRLSNVDGYNVVSTSMSCSATTLPILSEGADIVWADVNPVTGNIAPKDVLCKVNSATAAIMGIDWGGNPMDAVELCKITWDRPIKVIEDACHAFGSIYRNSMVGSKCMYPDFIIFSFQAIKILTVGDGGLLVCKSEEDYHKAKLMRWYGIDREENRKDMRCENDVFLRGDKWHLNDICATIGLENLKDVDRNLAITRANAAYYDRHLIARKAAAMTGSTLPSYWLYTIHLEDRNTYIDYMKEHEVQVSKVHSRCDKHTIFAPYHTSLPGVDEFCRTHVSIPVGWWVTPEDREYIARLTNEFILQTH